MDEEESGLEEGGFVSELLNWVSSVLQDSFLSVDEGNAGDAVNSVHVSWII